MLRFPGYLRKSAYEEEGGEGEGEPTVLLDSAAARLVKTPSKSQSYLGGKFQFNADFFPGNSYFKLSLAWT